MSSVDVTAVAYQPADLPAAAIRAASPVLGPGTHTATPLGTLEPAWHGEDGERRRFWVGRYRVTTGVSAAADATLASIDAALEEAR